MARAVWTGSVGFGLVNVPVRLYPATEQKDVHFHLLEEGTGRRIHNRRVAEGTGEEVPYDRVVKGYEVDRGRHVVVTPEELEAVEPGRSRTIEVEDFVDLAEIDPVHFERAYYVVPADDPGAQRAYALLREVMGEAGRVAIARFVMRTKQYLAAIRPRGDVLVLETMYFPDEVRDVAELEPQPAHVRLRDRELRGARQLVDALTTGWDPSRYEDTYRERVLDLVERKAKGEEVVVEEEAPAPPVVDLVAALEASLGARRGTPVGGRHGARRGPARAPGSRERRSGRRRGSAGAGRWREMSRDELYEEAKRRKIPGRSRMSRDELAEVLAKAS